MLVLLPPSETKRDGGADDSVLDLDALSFPSLTPARKKAIAGLRTISKSVAASNKALGLGPKQRFEIDRNRALATSPTMPAIERYTGVLFDALSADTLTPAARSWLDTNVAIHSALFGIIRAGDPVPAYRFSHDTRIASTSLPKLWSAANAGVLAAEPGLILDLRSESYVHLGPAGERSVFVRVVSDDGTGHRRALNHFNKHGKGELVRKLSLAGLEFETIDELVAWAESAGVELMLDRDGELKLVV